MAGPVSTNEIEDFVSSVRRLVSIEVHDVPGARAPEAEKLVLTSAHRIASEGATAAEPLILTTRAVDAEVSPFAAGKVEPVQLVEAEWEEEIWAEPEPPLAELALGAEEAELVTEPALVQSESTSPAPEAAPAPAEVASGTEKDGSPWAEVGDDWLDEDLELLKPGEAPPVAEPPAGTAETQAKRPDVLKLSAEQMLTDGEGNPLTVLDEAALQQIIRQLIRDELKGVLGERITHSVRKLVRAEINRALAAHALD